MPLLSDRQSRAPRWAQQIKYEAELDPAFPDKITALHGAEKLLTCIQCGTCTGSCPMSPYMDFSPRQIIEMTRAGFKREVLGSFMIWLCSSCYACTVACPKNIKITEVMYALKRLAIREGYYPKRFTIPVLAREFYNSVWANGRSSEGQLILQLYLRTNPLLLLQQAPLGMRLWLRGRMSLMADRVKGKGEVRALLPGRVEGLENGGAGS